MGARRVCRGGGVSPWSRGGCCVGALLVLVLLARRDGVCRAEVVSHVALGGGNPAVAAGPHSGWRQTLETGGGGEARSQGAASARTQLASAKDATLAVTTPDAAAEGQSRDDVRSKLGDEEEAGYVSRRELQQLGWKFQRDGIIILLVCNVGYFDFFENWANHARSLSLDRHFIAMAEDAESFYFLEKHWPGHGVRVHVAEIEEGGEGGGGSSSAQASGQKGVHGLTEKGNAAAGDAKDINSAGFKRIMYRRIFYLRALMAAGLHVLLCDVDTFFLKDPWPYFREGFDIYGVVEIPETYNFGATQTFLRRPNSSMFLCGGFLLFRNTPYAWLILDHLLLKIFRTDASASKHMNDQTYLHNALQDIYWKIWGYRPRVGILPQQLFPPGWLFFRNATWRAQNWNRVVWVHNNWVQGKEFKVLRYRQLRLWKVREPHRSDRFCALGGTCPADSELDLLRTGGGLESLSSLARQDEEGKALQQHAQDGTLAGASDSDDSELEEAPEKIPEWARGTLFDDAAGAKAVLRTQSSRGLGRGFVVFSIPAPGEELLLDNWVASLQAAGLGSHFVLFALSKGLHRRFEDLWPGHSVLLSGTVQAAATEAIEAAAEPDEDAPSSKNMQDPVPPLPLFVLELQPHLLQAALATVQRGTVVVYSEADSVITRSIHELLPSTCSISIALHRPVPPELSAAASLDKDDKELAVALRGSTPVSAQLLEASGARAQELNATARFFAVRADATGLQLAHSWVQEMNRQQGAYSRSLPAAEQAERLMAVFSQAVQTALGGKPEEPHFQIFSKGSSGRPKCLVAALPRSSFPPDYLVFKHPLWLRANFRQVALVRNDEGRAQPELVQAYKDLGLWALK